MSSSTGCHGSLPAPRPGSRGAPDPRPVGAARSTAGAQSPELRLFFALTPDPATRRRIHAIARSSGLDGRAVPAARLHATLAFLGQVPAGRLDDLRQLAAGVPLERSTVVLGRIGSFRRAGVAWLGPNAVPDGLSAFRERLVAKLVEAGFAVDGRAWKLHVTLYRDLRSGHGRMTVDPVPWDIDSFELMESSGGPPSPHYRVRGRWAARPAAGHREGA